MPEDLIMSHDLTVSFPELTWRLLSQRAAATGMPAEEIVQNVVQQHLGHEPRNVAPKPGLGEDEARASWLRLERHFGAVSISDPTGLDNDALDADLAKEYGDTHSLNSRSRSCPQSESRF
jgi:hypothetical protein